MIYCLTGTISEKTMGEVVIDCGGVGYLLKVPAQVPGQLPAVGSVATVYTHMNVSENDVALFGFASAEERRMFKTITKVSGVGPKVGLAILSALAPGQITLAIGTGDHKAFTAAVGVGPKLAQRIVLELKDKIGDWAGGAGPQAFAAGQNVPVQGAQQQAVAALASLGYSQGEAMAAVNNIDALLPVSEIIRLALQGMAKGR